MTLWVVGFFFIRFYPSFDSGSGFLWSWIGTYARKFGMSVSAAKHAHIYTYINMVFGLGRDQHSIMGLALWYNKHSKGSIGWLVE